MFNQPCFDIPCAWQHSLLLYYTSHLFLTTSLTHKELLQEDWQLPNPRFISHGPQPKRSESLSGLWFFLLCNKVDAQLCTRVYKIVSMLTRTPGPSQLKAYNGTTSLGPEELEQLIHHIRLTIAGSLAKKGVVAQRLPPDVQWICFDSHFECLIIVINSNGLSRGNQGINSSVLLRCQ